ncbi:hypothetical protein ElyMa_000586400 [Elysia marginata]|uniref:MULE transposase domain-containing protein n=1 Tax=Elysia marginata TaxID=1093978 RepID=A0AAV4G5C0_9GAST|nr:hypothetical protein ElyMa_000586400 [Elysia marginata]
MLERIETTRGLQIELCPEEMFVDLEVSVHAALSSTWPSCEIRLCHFHLSQVCFRKIQELGLTAEYKKRVRNRTMAQIIFRDSLTAN